MEPRMTGTGHTFLTQHIIDSSPLHCRRWLLSYLCSFCSFRATTQPQPIDIFRLSLSIFPTTVPPPRTPCSEFIVSHPYMSSGDRFSALHRYRVVRFSDTAGDRLMTVGRAVGKLLNFSFHSTIFFLLLSACSVCFS